MATTILSLPQELLTAVMEQMAFPHAISCLTPAQWRLLRFACKAFAYNHRVLKEAFPYIQLMADVTRIRRLSITDIALFAPFVKTAYFVPPLYNWHIDFDTFVDLFRKSIRHRALRQLNLPPPVQEKDVAPVESCLLEGYDRKRLVAAFKNYSAIAARNRELLEDSASIITAKWAKILRMLPKCKTFDFTLVDYAELTEELKPDASRCIHCSATLDMMLITTQDATADLTAGLALEAMARARVQPEMLDLMTAPMQRDLWRKNLRNELLNLEGIERLFISRRTDLDDSDTDAVTQADDLREDADYVLSRCFAGVKRLCVMGWEEWQWTSSIEALPNLRDLALDSCEVPCSLLLRWMSAASNLEELSLTYVGVAKDDSQRRWKQIFDAIRDHPNAIMFEFEPTWGDEVGFYFMRHTTRAISKDKKLEELGPENDFYDDAAQMLAWYLDDRHHWTEELDVVFHDSA